MVPCTLKSKAIMTNEAQQPAFTAEQIEVFRKLEGIFMPHVRKQRDRFYSRDAASGVAAESARFVHYTTATAALSIINSKRIWMRNALCMSDYREVQHGYNILRGFFSNETNKSAFTDALDSCVPGAAGEAIALFNQWWSNLQLSTYVASISEHDAKEDLHGRLSMWRAFGGNTARVALVVNIPWVGHVAQALRLLFSPVAYPTEAEAHSPLHQATANIKAHNEFLRSVDRQMVVGSVLSMLVIGVTCLKHEGFREEREWRAIYLPHNLPSPLMESSTEVIGGVPQVIYKVPLDVSVSPALSGLEFSSIFDRLIIGPSQYPFPMYEAFTGALVKAGVPQETAKRRVFISGIPLRP
jgi:hypothetical protein